MRTRRDFLALGGKSLGLAALSSATVASLLRKVEAASKNVTHLTPEEAAMDEDYWSTIQNSFSVTRGINNLSRRSVGEGGSTLNSLSPFASFLILPS